MSAEEVWRHDPRYRLPEGDEIGRACSQPLCKREAIFVLMRSASIGGTRRPRRWYCCDLPDHSYGHRLINGKVMMRVRADLDRA